MERVLGGGSGHWDWDQMLHVALLTDADLRNFFKFAFVRNPFERILSLYLFYGSSPEGRPWNEKGVDREGGFRSWLLNSRIMKFTDKERDQYSYICDKDGKLMVDFVGRFEKLGEDWQIVCERIGQNLELPWVKTGKEHVENSYRNYYDDEMKQKVLELFPRDFEKFGYQF